MSTKKGDFQSLQPADNSAALLPGPDYTATPRFDAAKYWTYLEGLEGTDAQKTALLEALWSIMAGFVQLGFGSDPVRTVIPGLIARAQAGSDAPDDAAVIERQAFNAAAGPHSKKEDEA